jgi:predicted transcriptional regulator
MTRTLVVTVESDEAFDEEVRSAIERLEDGESMDSAHTVSFPSEELLAETLRATTMAFLRALSTHEPASIRETARLVERDVKNVHDELTRLEAMGIIRFEEVGQAKKPVFPFDELIVNVPFPHSPQEDNRPATTS